MPRFKFEIQNCIDIFASGETKEEARRQIDEDLLDSIKDEFISSCVISNGVIVEDKLLLDTKEDNKTGVGLDKEE